MWKKRKLKILSLLITFGLIITFLIQNNVVLDNRLIRSPYLLRNLSTSNEFPSVHVIKNSLNGPQRQVLNVECAKIIEGDQSEINKAKQISVADVKNITLAENLYIELTKDCAKFKRDRRYMGIETVSYEERNFPVAYSILLYKDVGQAERLLRAIYRPHNIYCLHVDLSAKHVVHEAVRSIVKCFDNIFITSKLEDVLYEGMSRLRADLNCMRDLLAAKVKWKYFINLPSQQFPLKTNRELVKILRLYNGANDIEGITEPGRMMSARYKTKFVVIGKKLHNTGKKKEDPPHNISVVKGSAYGIFSRKFVDFILNNQTSKDLLVWLEEVKSPDEYYWATLHHDQNVRAPGGYTGVPDKKPWLATYAIWGGVSVCRGRFVRGVCVYGAGDLQELVSRKEIFANKFYYDYQPMALACMEEWLRNKTYSGLPFETYFYQNLPFLGRDEKT
ncbi:beta-1,3-galactosyl-O-glycosyl-glycoprotein beta-1,6-N-acetylglucosaminyltransferase-like [Mizuhopecten yessoensis]|uniref:Beta-1,3-galactosyl-O-glycosyl-glycoprotein beta-1,6-N-acetylglucosaminyltransferase n=1 Tax=Mizuhopecten yessoensis TaxID=6573 RepID=A0A210QA55_MIZYE|nr:beta-1,3-galactosyl-O-glycosyl-glycoprotein beta-1,6-N-acetylglucosaminyltransferase-like [Mizuhopecten yessoensis]XP_021363418.1 beta-1,3-galactosyl-O-glycosyl-glycoprotein beta-1,6-N-acetylglucosaminyltransferase-like [Mizuhopecten yessoensis]XP_021363419.1 beta-1,3-galactosyl-O-glycosyl-glycoprotein beta-1,6-N-acetylglucosaminyltransferase-like [Mizuhopecten yessoensis]XP_021363420.1 beta-1,3-galactosyl-O-glycosyl-glycoprotein beta-1,6-N-acetylglucosaminyltransferase-like [Mizuhopecten yes